jgi:hypothetical protein
MLDLTYLLQKIFVTFSKVWLAYSQTRPGCQPPEKRPASLAADSVEIKAGQGLDYSDPDRSTLSLFMTRLGANHTDDALALHNLALAANAFNGCSDFHRTISKKFSLIRA